MAAVGGESALSVKSPEEATGEYTGPLEEDLGNLMVSDNAPIEDEILGSKEKLEERSRAVLQRLINKLFKQPSQPAEGPGRLAELPEPTTRLPRQKPLPKARPLTRWEKFAKRKAIKKEKRSKLVWDELRQEWRRRHGYMKANDERDVPIVEAGANEQPGVKDPFSRMEEEKRKRVSAQKSREARNLQEMHEKGGTSALPKAVSVTSAAAETPASKNRRGELSRLTSMASSSTASLGKFDKAEPGEPSSARQRTGRKKRKDPVTSSKGGMPVDAQKAAKVATKVVESAEDVVDAERARKRSQQEQEQANAGSKRRKGTSQGSQKAKKKRRKA